MRHYGVVHNSLCFVRPADVMSTLKRVVTLTGIADRAISASANFAASVVKMCCRVPVSQSDMDTILRVMDPDQNGYITMEEWLDFMLSSDDSLEQETLCASQMQSKQNAEAGGDGIFEYIKYGEEAIDAIPGGIYFTKTLKDPIGAVVHVSNSTLHAVTNPVRAIEHDLLPVMGMPEQRKPLTGHWDPAGNSANARGGRPLTHEVELDEDDDLGDDDLGNTMENPLAGQPETEPEPVTDTV